MPPKAVTADWYSIDPRNSQQMPYSAADAATLERSFQAGEETCKLMLGGNPFTVNFRDMLQYNSSGGSRQVCRMSNEPDAPPTPLSDDLVNICTNAIRKMDAFVEHVEQKIEGDSAARQRGVISPLTGDEIAAFQAVYQHILSDFQSAKYKGKYGFNQAQDQGILGIRLGSSVPSYFANVAGQSIYQRKFLSILGLRNLVANGVTIFSQMLAKVFHGDVSVYPGATGPNLMRQLTGNVVDLDSVVLRCSDPQTVDVINKNLAKTRDDSAPVGGFKNGQELSTSQYGKKIAYESSLHLIKEFIDRFKLSPAEIQTRTINLPPSFAQLGEVPVAGDNSARSKWPMWLYNNVGVLTFHANVPTMGDVYGALLKAPFHFVKAYFVARQAEDLQTFFEEALSDSCFNQKWKAIEEYLKTRQQIGTIVNVLNELHKSRADIFTNEFYDNDDDLGTNELAVMLRLVSTARLQGVDEATRKARPITDNDVRQWHKRLMGAI